MAISKGKESAITKKRPLVAYTHPESIISEQYRMIQANIKFSMIDKRSRTFLITSPSKGEGKSTTAANLAISLAQQKEKILLIDANLRNPELHSIFKIQNSVGLTDILIGRTSFFDAVHHTEIGRLDVLTSGAIPINPGELLSTPLLQEVLITSLKSYDVVLIDSHSVLELTDTKLLANQCDGVVLVIQKGKTSLDQAIEAKKVLEFAKATLIGVVINEC
ncbi:exopolysaccharide tyrosine-protein kinase [Neobacillus bataviensis LMG 21833]|uniref:non-specific protein-tyrosine kinase n=1 Tax=Neobacillus bataviensis LMG 21833 TaxID=1117379 RepID=K6DA42_9BACI|nr:CpsD/CapB family tyrosine-protein kinase [Neobacillus bataviensis]EKN69407.1 exopolysaccharide tyrosine-protein kinase [Neobacillus bataviensis LMG 21833]